MGKINAKQVWQELVAALQDTLVCGDLPGHLAAWWRVATGRVTSEDRIAFGPAFTSGVPEEQPASAAPAASTAGAALRG